MADLLLIVASASAAGAVALLRLAWARKQRSHVLNGAGWVLLLLGTVMGGAAAGAWGIAVVSIFAMGTAAAALAVAGIGSPPGRAKASNRRVGLLPEKGEPRRIGRRVGTFLLTVVAGFAVSVGLGLAMRGLGGLLGWSETDANVAALYTVPVAWSVLIFVLLMQERRRSQIVTLIACALPALLVLISGALR